MMSIGLFSWSAVWLALLGMLAPLTSGAPQMRPPASEAAGAVTAEVYRTVLQHLFSGRPLPAMVVGEETIPLRTIARRSEAWRAEFDVLPSALSGAVRKDTGFDWTGVIPATPRPMPRGGFPQDAQLVPTKEIPTVLDWQRGQSAADVRAHFRGATDWLAFSEVILSPDAADALVYFSHTSDRRDGQQAYAWVRRSGASRSWRVEKVIVDWNDPKVRPWTDLTRDDIAVMDACLKGDYWKYGPAATILKSYREAGDGGGEMIDRVEIELPPVLRKKFTGAGELIMTPPVWKSRYWAHFEFNLFSAYPKEVCDATRTFWGRWKVRFEIHE